MSHSVKIKSVPIRSVSALRSAVQRLNTQHGIRCELIQNAKPRMYYQDQLQRHGVSADGKCAYVLKLNDCKYDVGFVQESDGTLTPVFDDWEGYVEKVLGVSKAKLTKDEKSSAPLGKILREYTREATVEFANEQGHTIESIIEDESGAYQIEVSVQ